MRTPISRWFRNLFAPEALGRESAAASLRQMSFAEPTLGTESAENDLLASATLQWRVGDWEALAYLDRDTLERHPDRARIALLVASAHQQLDNRESFKTYFRVARDWGCDRRLIAQVLIAGVHNILGRAALAKQDNAKARLHFREAVPAGTSAMDVYLASETRQAREAARLAIPEEVAAP